MPYLSSMGMRERTAILKDFSLLQRHMVADIKREVPRIPLDPIKDYRRLESVQDRDYPCNITPGEVVIPTYRVHRPYDSDPYATPSKEPIDLRLWSSVSEQSLSKHTSIFLSIIL